MSNWYGAPMPTGKTAAQGGTGSFASPWDIFTIASGAAGQIHPGDTVWLLDGKYGYADVGNVDNQITWVASGTIGTGKDNIDQKLIVRNYKGDTDIMNQARANLQNTNTTAAASVGAVTVNGVNNVGSNILSVNKVTNSQAVEAGHQLTITSGPAAGVYVITANNTLIVGNTNVNIEPRLRGTTAGAESITLALNITGIDNLQVKASYVWFWGLELSCVMPYRTWEGGGPTNFSTFATGGASPSYTTDGVKLIHCIVHDASGGVFQDRHSNRWETYGCIFYNHGYAGSNITDGGGHQIYIHHSGNANQDVATYEGNVLFNDEGVAMQIYDGGGATVGKEELVDWKRNISFNMGVCNKIVALGGNDAQGWVVGGPQTMSGMNVTNNYSFWPDQYGDQTIQFGGPGQQIKGNNVISGNYLYGGGSGFGKIYFPTTVSGTVTVKNNTMRVQKSEAFRNGRIINIVDSGKNMIWGNNVYYRSLGLGGNACGDETGSVPQAFKDSVGGCRTLTNFLADTGFTGDILLPDPVSFSDIFIVPTPKYESGRGYVVYYNYANLLSIPADLSLLGFNPGDVYVIHDVRNVWSDIGSTTGRAVLGPYVYGGGKVNLPTTQLTDPPMSGALWGIGNETTPPTTAPQFNVFLVRRVSTGWPNAYANATLLDFGTFPGSSDASVVITGQTTIAETSLVEAWIYPRATGDHTADEHIINPPWVVAGSIVPGVGFTIFGRAQSEIEMTDPFNFGGGNAGVATSNSPLVYGQWTVAWAWR